jgi:DNA polymerase (family X)
VKTLAELRKAAESQRIRRLRGFGAKIEAHIVEVVSQQLLKNRRFSRALAAQHAEPLAKYLRAVPGVTQVVLAGSYRRLRETVGDIDILVVVKESRAVLRSLIMYGEVADVLVRGRVRASVRLNCGLQVDLRVIPAGAIGAALAYFTGSKAHNIALRRLALTRGLKLNEYGAFRGQRRIAGSTEQSVYRALGLAWIPPRSREDQLTFGVNSSPDLL